MQTCIMCGKPGKLTDNGWVMPLCKDCEEKYNVIHTLIDYIIDNYYRKYYRE